MANNAVGLFHEPEGALEAAGKLKNAGFSRPDIFSPIPLHGVEEILGKKKNRIKHFTFFGAIFGGLSGFLLAAGTAVMFVHPTGGRPVIAFPPFLIITYEMTILFGIVATVLGFLIFARLPAIKERLYVPEAAVDKFAVTVACDSDEQFGQASAILRETGAEEVRQMSGIA